VSTENNEVSSAFTPDGKELYFAIFSAGAGYQIMVMKGGERGWTRPQVAPFSGRHSEVDMFITHDGGEFFFISKRPVQDNGERSRGYQIWVMERQDGAWGDPVHLGPQINGGSRQLYPTVTRKGVLYFSSDRDGFGKMDVFRSPQTDGTYEEPENLGSSINTENDETDLLVAPDESFVIFTSVGRPDGFGSGDLYISFQQEDESWTPAENMGDALNTSSSEFCPMLSPDGEYFFFTSGRRGNDDIYWVDAGIIDRYRPE
jgi:Tol biopolymer transport system component